MFVLTGDVLDVEHQSGKSQDGTPYAYTRVYVLAGRDVHRCRVGDNYGTVTKGEVITAEVSISAYTDRNRAAHASITLLRPVEDRVPLHATSV